MKQVRGNMKDKSDKSCSILNTGKKLTYVAMKGGGSRGLIKKQIPFMRENTINFFVRINTTPCGSLSGKTKVSDAEAAILGNEEIP